jgi:uncharacterized protein YjaZ
MRFAGSEQRGVRSTVIALLAACSACEARIVDVELVPEGRAFSSVEERAIRDIAESTTRNVRALIPTLPKRITLVVQPGKESVIPETGETGTTAQPSSVYWTVDPDRDVLSIIRKELRRTLFHELHHLARDARVARVALLDAVVTEGLATAFERDFGGAHPPWGEPVPEIEQWTREILQQPPTAARETWLFRHPDGRRWIGLRVGTYLIDRAMKTSGRTSAELVLLPTAEILQLAGVGARE